MVFDNLDAAYDCNCDGGSDSLGNNVIGCMSDESDATSCLEVKASQGMKLESNHVPAAMSAVTLKLISESIMSQGTLRVSPYDTSSEILDTNGVTTAEWLGAQTEDITISSTMIDDMATDLFRLRVWEDGSGGKVKMGEVEIEATIATIALIAESRDDDDNLVVSCGANLMRKTGSFPYTYFQLDSATTDGTLGTHTFNYEDDGAQYVIIYLKELSPDQWDMSDEVQGS